MLQNRRPALSLAQLGAELNASASSGADPVDEAEASRRRIAFLVGHLRAPKGHPALGDPVRVLRIAAREQTYQASRLAEFEARLAVLGPTHAALRGQLLHECREASALQEALTKLMRRASRSGLPGRPRN